MTKDKNAESEPDAPEPKKRSAFIGKLIAARSYILHSALVLLLFSFFVWQVLDFYQLSTNYNRSRAVKTNHMVIYDIQSGKTLTALPNSAEKTEKETAAAAATTTPDETHPTEAAAQEETALPEIAVIITGLGKDPKYTSEVTSLPPEFIFSYSPYGNKPLETSKYKAAEGASVIAEVNYSDGKFDIGAKNTDFRNANNVEAAVSKVYGASSVYITAPDNYVNSESFTSLASALEQRQTQIVVPVPYKGDKKSVIPADMVIKTGADIKAALAKLEQDAHDGGYALAVVEPQPGAATILKEWAGTLAAKKIKLIPVIKN